MTVTEYVVGFLFSPDNAQVCLIRKKRPPWQAGRLNGVGGHIEQGETPAAAMRREFEEEAGLSLEWRYYALLWGTEYRLFCFTAVSPSPIGCHDIRPLTDEVPGWWIADYLPDSVLPNLRWLVPMAKYEHEVVATIHHESPTC